MPCVRTSPSVCPNPAGWTNVSSVSQVCPGVSSWVDMLGDASPGSQPDPRLNHLSWILSKNWVLSFLFFFLHYWESFLVFVLFFNYSNIDSVLSWSFSCCWGRVRSLAGPLKGIRKPVPKGWSSVWSLWTRARSLITLMKVLTKI